MHSRSMKTKNQYGRRAPRISSHVSIRAETVDPRQGVGEADRGIYARLEYASMSSGHFCFVVGIYPRIQLVEPGGIFLFF